MARKNAKTKGSIAGVPSSLSSGTKKAIVVVLLCVVGILLTLAALGSAGPAGTSTYVFLRSVLGVGYFLVPILLFTLAGVTLKEDASGLTPLKIGASVLFFFSGLGFIDVVAHAGGILGKIIAYPEVRFFDVYASLILLGGATIISLLILVEGNISPEPFIALGQSIRTGFAMLLGLFKKSSAESDLPLGSDLGEETLAPTHTHVSGADSDIDDAIAAPPKKVAPAPAVSLQESRAQSSAQNLKGLLGEYTPPPLSLLERDKGRPGVGDIKANANIIKRTLANFGIVVEIDEISIGPSVTRYAVKPAEGVRLQKILTLQKNLELALSAGSIRIEAPIPGKSLVGIEVPNSAKVTVGLGTLLESPEFVHSAKPLFVAMGRDIAGGSLFANIAKMPHALIAGATGSGKSVTIHTLINSLLFRCGPQQLRFIMIDPKRVELTLYRSLPHLLTPVITDAKKAIMALRWAGKEMERRYNILEGERVRDIESYHQNILTPALERIRKEGELDEGEKVPEAMPYIVIIIDELADIMQTYPRELEASVVRLAQMSRAVGIHLVLSTQRPSVNVITGLIKANIPARVALQVASQIDSRTILDQGGAENLLGSGDMLYLSSDMPKPVRLQSAFISENEVKKIVDYITKHNEAQLPVDIGAPAPGATSISLNDPDMGGSGGGLDEDVDDDMYEAARAEVVTSGKASTSYLQRKLRIGYARAARIIDILEERGVIGPGDGAKPREILERGGGSSSAPSGESQEEL